MSGQKQEGDDKKHTQEDPAVYWSVLHHKNVHEGLHEKYKKKGEPFSYKPVGLHAESDNNNIPKEVVQPTFVKEVSSRSALTSDYGYGSTSTSPLNVPQLEVPQQISESQHTSKSQGWHRVREIVNDKELLIRDIPQTDGENGTKTKRWSDITNMSYEFTLRECLALFIALLMIGGLAYSFCFNQWSIIDSLYFTIVTLTTCGYGDITPTTPGGKVFASVFALAGVVILGLVLGVVGSQLVEAEINYTENAKAKSSKAVDNAFTRRSRHRRHSNNGHAESSLSKGYDSMSSLESMDSTGSSVYDTESCPTRNLNAKSRRRSNIREEDKEFPGVALVARHLPGLLPFLFGGLIMAKLEHWSLIDTVYYCVVTSTTIGFGDLTPGSELSKAVAILFIPIAVASMGYILGNVASHIVERRREEYTKKLWSTNQIRLEDIEALDESHDGAVSELEYIKFMLVAMKKVEPDMFDDLHEQFKEMDQTGDGQITKRDLALMASRRLRKVSHKLKLAEYKQKLTKQGKVSGLQCAVRKVSQSLRRMTSFGED